MNQQQVDSLLLYMGKHGCHVGELRLSSKNSSVTLQPNSALVGSLSFFEVMQQLQQLTSLELGGTSLQVEDTPAELPLQALTRLVDLKLRLFYPYSITPGTLSGAAALTGLLLVNASFCPACLAGKTQLKQVMLSSCSLHSTEPGTAEVEQLLSQRQSLQQLCSLSLKGCLRDADSAATSSFSALTASSNLEHLDLRGCTLPANVWQQLFPDGRQLAQLQSLDISLAQQPSGPDAGLTAAAAPAGSRLVSCCPGLCSLDMQGLQYSSKLLAPLQGLSELSSLRLAVYDSHLQLTDMPQPGEVLNVVSQFTGLRQLLVRIPWVRSTTEGRLLQLAALKQLTALTYAGPVIGWGEHNVCLQEVSDVYQYVLRLCWLFFLAWRPL